MGAREGEGMTARGTSAGTDRHTLFQIGPLRTLMVTEVIKGLTHWLEVKDVVTWSHTVCFLISTLTKLRSWPLESWFSVAPQWRCSISSMAVVTPALNIPILSTSTVSFALHSPAWIFFSYFCVDGTYSSGFWFCFDDFVCQGTNLVDRWTWLAIDDLSEWGRDLFQANWCTPTLLEEN